MIGTREDTRVVISVKDVPVNGKDLGEEIKITSDDQRDFNNLINNEGFHLLDIILTEENPIINHPVQITILHEPIPTGEEEEYHIILRDEHDEGEEEKMKTGWFLDQWETMGDREMEIAQANVDKLTQLEKDNPPPIPIDETPFESERNGIIPEEAHDERELFSDDEMWEEVPAGEFFDHPQIEYIEQGDNHIENSNPEEEWDEHRGPKYLEEWVDNVDDTLYFHDDCYE